MTMGKYLEDERKRKERIAKDVKLTKDGMKYATLNFDRKNKEKSQEVIEALFASKDINYNLWNGLASNPEIDGDTLLLMLRKLKEVGDKELAEYKKMQQELNDAEDVVKKLKSDSKKVRFSGNSNLSIAIEKANEAHSIFRSFEKQVKKSKTDRDIVRKIIAQHPNQHEETLKKLLFGGKGGGNEFALQNPALSTNLLNMYFDLWVLPDGKDYGSRYIYFKKLMKSKNITREMVDIWYNKLKKYADWSYRNSWYETISTLLDFDDVSENILLDIVSAPFNKSPYEFSETYREQATQHKNATEDVFLKAYEISENKKFLPEYLKNMFMLDI